LILQSLDLANQICSGLFPEDLKRGVPQIDRLKEALKAHGFSLVGEEPLKITLATKGYGYTGQEVEEFLREQEIFCEFADSDFVVMMFAPLTAHTACQTVARALGKLPPKEPILTLPPAAGAHEQVLSPRAAMLSPSEVLPIENCVGRILASPSVGCPPAVPLLVCGQRITAADLPRFRYYGIDRLRVVKNA
jgi:arginine/lysine/ornithine decarboxylase